MPNGACLLFVRGVVVVASLFLTACASLQDKVTDSQDGPEIVCGPALERFDLRGRAMIRQGQRIDHLRFDWAHAPATDRLLLTTPFGQGVAQITREHRTARVLFADGRQIERENLVELSKELFGSALPLDELAEWLRGAHAQRHALSKGWEVAIEQVDAFTVAGQVHWLPRAITATQGDIVLRLVIDERDAAND